MPKLSSSVYYIDGPKVIVMSEEVSGGREVLRIQKWNNPKQLKHCRPPANARLAVKLSGGPLCVCGEAQTCCLVWHPFCKNPFCKNPLQLCLTNPPQKEALHCLQQFETASRAVFVWRPKPIWMDFLIVTCLAFFSLHLYLLQNGCNQKENQELSVKSLLLNWSNWLSLHMVCLSNQLKLLLWLPQSPSS